MKKDSDHHDWQDTLIAIVCISILVMIVLMALEGVIT